MAEPTTQRTARRAPPPAVARTGIDAAVESPLVTRREIAGAGQHLFRLFQDELMRRVAQQQPGARHEA